MSTDQNQNDKHSNVHIVLVLLNILTIGVCSQSVVCGGFHHRVQKKYWPQQSMNHMEIMITV